MEEPGTLLQVAGFTALAAAVSALGAVPVALRDPVPRRWLGWANAVASGLMLGAAYLLSEEGREWPPLPLALGAVLGVGLSLVAHHLLGSAELDLNPDGDPGPEDRRRVYLKDLVHGAAEGVPFGVAMGLDLRLGVILAVGLAVHNVAEAATLCAVLGRGEQRPLRPAFLAVASDLPAVPTAVAAFLVMGWWPPATPWLLGLGYGALVYLVMVDLLPEAYREAGHTSIALLVSVALGAIVLLEGALH